MNKPVINLIFRKPAPQFNSIENVFDALFPHIGKEFSVRRVYLPYRTRGLASMRKNQKFIARMKLEGISHVTGHENYIIRALPGKKILTFHDIGSASVGKTFRDKYIQRNWFRIPLNLADRVTAISDFSFREISSKYPGTADKFRVIPNPVSDKIRYAASEFRREIPEILFVGTKKNKNLERAVEALSGIPCRLTILGELSPVQQDLLDRSGIEFRNEVYLPYSEVLELYKFSDILLFPSLYEGFGMPILEAQATGRVVITSNRGAMPFTAGEGALLVDPENIGEIRTAVEKVIQDENTRKLLIEKGVENIQRFKADIIAAQYMEMYTELIHEA